MKVSYITTVYNKAPFLPFVVRGLASQTGEFEREFIFVDDGSTDGSADVLADLTNTLPNVTIVRRPNGGMSVALNEGLDRVSGDVVKLVDGDDVLVPSATETLLALLDQDGVVISSGDNGLYRPSTGEQIGSLPAGPAIVDRHDDPLQRLIRNAYFNPSSSLIDGAVARRVRCDPRIFIGDVFFWLQAARFGAVVRTDRVVFLAPEQAPGRITDNTAQVLHDLNLALAYFLERTPDLEPRYRKQIIRRATGRSWRWARRHGDAGLMAAAFGRYLLGKTGLVRDPARLVLESCRAFRSTSGPSVRVMPATARDAQGEPA